MSLAVGHELTAQSHPKPLRVGFFGQSGPYAVEALRLLRAHGGADFEITWVIEGVRRLPLRRSWRILRPSWFSKNTKKPECTLVDLAHLDRVPVVQTTDVHCRGVLKILAMANLDVLLCAGFDRLFNAQLRAQFQICLNAHPAPLPKWRGPSPLFWCLRSAQRQSAVTVHLMDAGEDHGPIVQSTPFSWPSQANGMQITTLAGKMAGGTLLQTLRQLRNAPLRVVTQAHKEATRAPRPRSEDVKIEPLEWRGQALLDFACAAPFFKTPWLQIGSDTFFIRSGVHFTPNVRIPGDFALFDNFLNINCQDGFVCLQLQS